MELVPQARHATDLEVDISDSLYPTMTSPETAFSFRDGCFGDFLESFVLVGITMGFDGLLGEGRKACAWEMVCAFPFLFSEVSDRLFSMFIAGVGFCSLNREPDAYL